MKTVVDVDMRPGSWMMETAGRRRQQAEAEAEATTIQYGKRSEARQYGRPQRLIRIYGER
jgi:hypothetical protein